MTENLENQNFANNRYLQTNDLPQVENQQIDAQQHENFMKGLADYVIERYNNKQTANEKKKKLIESNLADYNSDNYLKNQDFMNLYNEAIDILGEELDTKKFINLIDKYVESRMLADAKARSAKDENSSITDSLAYNAGVSAKTKDNLRFQDLSDEELPLYIAKYL